MITKIYSFESVGKKHAEQYDFFKFLVRQAFAIDKNNSYQWLEFKGFEIILKCVEIDIVKFAERVICKGFTTETGYDYKLIKIYDHNNK